MSTPCGADPGLYVIAFWDCPACHRLIDSLHFRLMLRYIQQYRARNITYKVIIIPRIIPGLNTYEYQLDDFDNCMAYWALASAHIPGVGAFNTTLTYELWSQATYRSPILVIIPIKRRQQTVDAYIVPHEIVALLLSNNRNDVRFGIDWILTHLIGKSYVLSSLEYPELSRSKSRKRKR